MNDDTQNNFKNSSPELGTFEKYGLYPDDQFICLTEELFNKCWMRSENGIFKGGIEISLYYLLEKHPKNYRFSRL